MVAVLLLHGGQQSGVRPEASFGRQTGAARHPKSDRHLCPGPRERAVRSLVDKGLVKNYDHAFQTLQDVPCNRWREYDPENTVCFYPLRLHEVGMIKSSPQKLIARGTD